MPARKPLKDVIDLRVYSILKASTFEKMDAAQKNDSLKIGISWYKTTHGGDSGEGGWFDDDTPGDDHD